MKLIKLFEASIEDNAFRDGVYISRKVDKNSWGIIGGIGSVVENPSELQFDTDDFYDDLHTTVMYAPDQQPPNESWSLDGSMVDVAIVGADLFGPERDTLVLLLKSDRLMKRFAYWTGKGLQSTYPEHKPHITIQLKSNEKNLSSVLKYIEEQPQMVVKLCGETMKPLVKKWNEKTSV